MSDYSPALLDDNTRECPDCGLFSRLPPRQPRVMVADCPRCSAALCRMHSVKTTFPLACALAGLVFYALILTAPLLEISGYGQFSVAWLETGPLRLSLMGWKLLAALVFAVTLILPGVKVGMAALTLLGLELNAPKPLIKALFRWYLPLSPWAMIDVYLLGFLVAYTKLSGMFSVQLDNAIYALIGLMVAMAALDGSLDHEMIWHGLEPIPAASAHVTSQTPSCHICGLLNEPGHKYCARCHARLHLRKPASISRCWAFTIASACLYVPANIYPVMTLTSFGHTNAYTIMGGIIELGQAGLWPLALLVFFASIAIPMLKLIALSFMLLSTQIGSARFLQGRTVIYRMIVFIGRWSMIDVFMVSLLVALVHFGQLANIAAGTGILCFAAVVILTIIAVDVFDPRLMWDHVKEPRA